MIIPWRVTEKNRDHLLAHLLTFEAQVWAYHRQGSNPPTPWPLSDEMRQEIILRMQQDMDPQRDVWIASGRHTMLYALLHAEIASQSEAWVELLCAFPWGYNRRTALYEGFGEFVLLTSILEQMGVSCFSIPLALDSKYTGVKGQQHEPARGVYSYPVPEERNRLP